MGWWTGFWPASWLSYGLIIMLLLMAGCGLVMYFMMRRQRSEWRNDIALHILRERYARGEIDKAEYEERRRGLEA
jgi:putative membrane protein